MYFLFSGEGPTDLGSGRSGAEIDEHLAGQFEPGPLAHLVDQMVEDSLGFSPLESRHCGFVAESALSRRKEELNPTKKTVILRGAKRPKETGYFFNNARILARIAREQRSRLADEPVVAILFRDADGTASAGRGNWSDKHDSILRGFAVEGWGHGVPMLANPKSEAWILCALQAIPYQNCARLEDASGNDASPQALKSRLEVALESAVTRDQLCGLAQDRTIDHARIDMVSFNALRVNLARVMAPGR